MTSGMSRSPRAQIAARMLSICSLLALLLLATGCASSRSKQSTATIPPNSEVGVASYYAHRYHGKRTASGESYNMHQMTAAHPRLSFGSRAKVTNLHNGRSVIVRINDRGPFVRGRVIDLSFAAARELDMIRRGLARVQVDYLPSDKFAKTKD